MKIYVGADHAGFQLKEELVRYLSNLGYELEDMGPYEYDPDDDYPDFILPVAKAVAQDLNNSRGIVVGGSGQGEAICASKVKGIRAAVLYDEYSARMSREDNDANIAALGARATDAETAKKLIGIWLETSFSGVERHVRRIKKITEFEACSQ